MSIKLDTNISPLKNHLLSALSTTVYDRLSPFVELLKLALLCQEDKRYWLKIFRV